METLKSLTYEEIVKITDDFSQERLIGQGGFGKVYKGTYNNEAIAVKVLHTHVALGSNLSFEKELCNIWRLRHDNIVRLIACCDETHGEIIKSNGVDFWVQVTKRALCFDYMENGSLEKYLSDESVELDWRTAYKIIKGTCEGILYLHKECKMLHLDLKPENILLNNNMVAKLADFGLSKLINDKGTMVTETKMGTLGYMPPEYIKGGKFSDKFDIFSLGVVIFKMVAGTKIFSDWETMSSEEIIELAEAKWRSKLQATCSDSSLLEEYCNQVKMCTEIALNCLKHDRNERPSIEDTLNCLKHDRSEGPSIVDTIDKMDHMEIAVDKPRPVVRHKEARGGSVVSYKDMASHASSFSSILPDKLPAKVLKEITNNFSPDNIRGQSVFGVVYEGTLPGGALIAVKRLTEDSAVQNDSTFDNELKYLKDLKHKNIIKLVGFCNEKEKSLVNNSGKYTVVHITEICLCYEYLPRGTIDKYIYVSADETTKLDWDTRFKIIKGVCKGLHYLHKELLDGPIVHMNLVPSSIWLDDNWVPKIADFGHSRLFGQQQGRKNTMNVKGQIGYLAPEYLYRGEISTMSDIYCLGMVILEITTGVKNFSHNEDRTSRMYVEDVRQNWNIDDHIIRKYPSLDENGHQQVKACILIGQKCVAINRQMRPSIVQIVDKLNGKYVEMFDTGMEKLQVLTYEELVKITDDFSEGRKIGHGGFGKVYEGTYNNETIAVKVLHNHVALDSKLSFENELCNIWRLRHDNIVRLIACCDETHSEIKNINGMNFWVQLTKRALCFEYMQNGSLEKYLSDECVELDWRTAYKIIKGTCEGIKYLHEECKMLHLDLKPENILLDNNMVAKLADFGLSKLVKDKGTMVTETATGTLGYMPPEFVHGGTISDKFDIFSLGVVIFKVVAGREIYSDYETMSSEEIIDLAEAKWRSKLQATCSDSSLLEEYCNEVKMCTEIALNCLKHDRNERPSIVDTIDRMDNMEIAVDKPRPVARDEEAQGDMASHASSFSSNISSILPDKLPAKVLKEITNNFSPDNIRGLSIFGVVYEGTLPGGVKIAVKRLTEDSAVQNVSTFDNEVANHMNLQHRNIIKLVGFCNEKEKTLMNNRGRYVIVDIPEICLCYEYPSRGTIDKYIYVSADETTKLDWDTRFKIIKGFCKGLHYLHRELLDGPIVHMNLVPSSIWLDDNWVPKIADFGHSRLFGKQQSRKNTMNVKGQIGYLAPEYLYRGEISTMSDIYSLGMVILEIMTGVKNFSNNYDKASRTYVENVRQNWNTIDQIKHKYPSIDENRLQQVEACILIGLKCVEVDRNKRPSIEQIVDKLNGNHVEMFDVELEA